MIWIAYQFNEIADAIQQNLIVLRELAARNAELDQCSEVSAAQPFCGYRHLTDVILKDQSKIEVVGEDSDGEIAVQRRFADDKS